MNRLIPRNWGENFVKIFLIFRQYIFRGPSTCVVIDHSSSLDISFRSTPFVASTGSLPPLPRRNPPRISPRPFLRLSCFPLRSNLIQHCILWRIFPEDKMSVAGQPVRLTAHDHLLSRFFKLV